MRKSSFLAILFILVLPLLCAAAEPVLQGLHIEGISNSVYVVQVLKQDDVTYSNVFRRNIGETHWQMISSIPGVVTGTTSYGNDLILTLSDSSWIILGSSSGRPLPSGASLLSLVGDKSRLFALGQLASPGTIPATTQSSTQPATLRPGTPLVLFELIKGSWLQLAQLSLPQSTSAVGLGWLDNAPVVVLSGNGQIAASRFEQGQWQSLGNTPAMGQLAIVLGDSGQLLAFISETPGPTHLLVRKNEWLSPITMASDSQIRAMGLAGGQIRFIYADKDQIKERVLSPRTLKVEAPDSVLQLHNPLNIQDIRSWVQWSMMIVISLVMIYNYRNRDENQKVTIDWTKVQLAPLGWRSLAGMIDLLPIIIAMLYARTVVPESEFSDIFSSQTILLHYLLPSAGIYFVHTTIVEAIAGRSIGKIVTQLRVVRLDGKRPGVAALLIRNILRVVDMVVGVTLVFTLISPLRQRIGDMAAGTVVVCNRQENPVDPGA